MLRTHYSKDVPEREGEKIRVGGYIESVRDIGKVKFMIIRDKEGKIQITTKDEKIGEQINSMTKQSFVLVEGTVKLNKQAPGGREIVPTGIELLSKADVPLPLDPKIKSGLDKRLDWRVLDLRKPEIMAVFKIQSKLVEGMEEYLRKEKFIRVFTPCLIGTASEGGAEVFPVIYFDKEAFLRQDPQLHRELLISSGFDKIFDLGPNWRAEPSHTPRHLCEHRGCAVEVAFIKDETDTMRLEERLIVSAFKRVKNDCKEELELLEKDVKIPRTPFPELRFPDIYDILKKMGKEIEFGEDYDRESEKLLSEYVKEKYKHDFFFVNRFPFKAKPFYVMRVDENPQWARSVDLMFKGLEMSSGGQREHRYEKIIEQAKEKKLDLKNINWFTKFFRYGAPPMGGFNLGIERLTQKLLDLENIREATPFPRAPERLMP
ncbi:MAG: aspartate--tRNA(Asn) ligase [Candidatus Aenigmarchaeota archaeon]|nr:aspartate--tRNA(Asn) ligase [Candidatus Aenigmarchaeota archaeon]